MVSTEPLPEPPEPEEHHQPGQRSSSKRQDPPPAGDCKHIPVIAEESSAEHGLVNRMSVLHFMGNRETGEGDILHTQTKVPGRKTAVTMASVNIDTLSR